MKRKTFAPTAMAYLTEARGAGDRNASRAIGELQRLEALAREVRRHTRRRHFCGGTAVCWIRMRESANKIGDPQ